jgi:hypothetical protein
MDTQLLGNRPAYTLDRDTAPGMWLVGTLWLNPGYRRSDQQPVHFSGTADA